MGFHWRLGESKSPQVSRTLLSILAVFNNAVVWMVSPRPPTSKSSRPFNNPLVTLQKAPITIGIIVTFIFHSFFQFSSKVEVLISLFTFFQFYSVVSRDSKVDNFADFLFVLIISIIIIIIIISSSSSSSSISFPALIFVFNNRSTGFYPWSMGREGSDHMHSMYLCFLLPLSGNIFFIHIVSTLLKRWAVPQSAFFGISCLLGLSDIVLIY